MIIPRFEFLYLTVYSFRYNAHEPGTCLNCTLRFSKKGLVRSHFISIPFPVYERTFEPSRFGTSTCT